MSAAEDQTATLQPFTVTVVNYPLTIGNNFQQTTLDAKRQPHPTPTPSSPHSPSFLSPLPLLPLPTPTPSSPVRLPLTCTVADITRGFLLGDFGLSATDSLFPGERLIGAGLGRVGRLF